MNPTEAKRRARAAAVAKRMNLKPTAREMFAAAQKRHHDRRPLIGQTRSGIPIYGPTTFRNVIDEKGAWV